jgi:hypothetical protein
LESNQKIIILKNKKIKMKPEVLVHNEASNATVLFETADVPKAVLTGDDTVNGQISDSVNWTLATEAFSLAMFISQK